MSDTTDSGRWPAGSTFCRDSLELLDEGSRVVSPHFALGAENELPLVLYTRLQHHLVAVPRLCLPNGVTDNLPIILDAEHPDMGGYRDLPDLRTENRRVSPDWIGTQLLQQGDHLINVALGYVSDHFLLNCHRMWSPRSLQTAGPTS